MNKKWAELNILILNTFATEYVQISYLFNSLQSISSDREEDGASASQLHRAKRDVTSSSPGAGSAAATDVKLSDLATAFHLNDR